jgi:DNA-binding SARP family transcriptional activator/TolB-like protein
MFSLRLFGTPALADERGVLLSGRATQRHRLALLALLATAAGGGMSREKLMAWLWPESDAARARDLLNQGVYVLRKSLGEAALLTAGDELRLNPAVIASDVAAFQAAIEHGDPARAVLLYAGPFLDGFFVNGAPDFEHWVELERGRLASAHAGALESLAETAEAARDLPGAVQWWKARAAADPYDSRIALRLVQVLAGSGNVAGALQHMSVHKALLEEQFGMEPPAELLAAVERLRSEPPALAFGATAKEPAEPAAAPPRVEPDAEAAADAAVVAWPEPAAEASAVAAAASDAERARDPPPAAAEAAPHRRVTGLGLALLAVAAGLIVLLRPGAPARAPDVAGTPAIAGPSIAVLPLESSGDDAADVFLANGMTDELIALLTKHAELRVLSAATLFGSPDRPLDRRSAAERLGVSYLLEGGLQRSGSRLRVRVRLVRVSDGVTRWSESYDRQIEDIFAVQDDIAQAVARELGLRLVPNGGPSARRQPTHSVAAYELYLRGSDRTLLRSDSAARLGLAYLEQAIALDSTYAAAWAGFARMYSRVDPNPLRLERAEQAARRAVALDDSLAEAHATLGVIRMMAFDFAEAERHLNRAILLDPSHIIAYEWLVTLYLWTERRADALAHAERALRLDPLSPYAHAELARALLFNDRCDEALALVEPLAALQPPLLRAAPIGALCHARAQRWPEAIALLRPSAERGEPTVRALIGYALGRAGQREEALRIRDTLVQQWPERERAAFDVALVAAGLGDADETFVWLDRSLADGSLSGGPGNVSQLFLLDPVSGDLRDDPRLERVRARLGLQNR